MLRILKCFSGWTPLQQPGAFTVLNRRECSPVKAKPTSLDAADDNAPLFDAVNKNETARRVNPGRSHELTIHTTHSGGARR
jgi:hypothetical protein